MKSITVQDFDLIIFHLETGFSSKGNKKERLKSKLNPLYRKKNHLNVQVDFLTFLSIKKEVKSRRNRLSSF